MVVHSDPRIQECDKHALDVHAQVAPMCLCQDTKEERGTHIVHQRLAVASLDQKVIVDARMLEVMADCCTRHTMSELHLMATTSLST